MTLLALDQASQTTGYAIFKDSRLIQHGKFTFEDFDFGVRLTKIRNKIIELIRDNNIDQLVFEDIQLQQNVDTFKKLAEVFGVVYELATELNIPNEAILSSVWKSGLKIKGADRTSQKRAASTWVAQTYNLKVTQDEADAICIGAYYSSLNEMLDWSE